jgi:hypothetical protein
VPSKKSNPRRARSTDKTIGAPKTRALKVKKATQSELTRTRRKVASAARTLWRSAEDLLASAKKSAKKHLSA